jgi:hypothetical protein
MHYFNWIQKYRQQALSSADRQAYEHEQGENSRLHSEAEAVDLMESLLSVTASGLSEQEILGVQPSGKKSPWAVFAISGALLLLLLVCGYVYQQRLQKPAQPTTPVPVKEWGPRFFEPLDEYEAGEGPVALSIESTVIKEVADHPMDTHPEPLVRQVKQEPTIAIVLSSDEEANSEAIVEVKPKQAGDDIVLGNTKVDKGAALAISAKKSITLKAGFHAKAGATFRATVEDK